MEPWKIGVAVINVGSEERSKHFKEKILNFIEKKLDICNMVCYSIQALEESDMRR
jgi:hypothetical protein